MKKFTLTIVGLLIFTAVLSGCTGTNVYELAKPTPTPPTDQNTEFPITLNNGAITVNGFYINEYNYADGITSDLIIDITYADTLSEEEIDQLETYCDFFYSIYIDNDLNSVTDENSINFEKTVTHMVGEKDVPCTKIKRNLFHTIQVQKAGKTSLQDKPINLVFTYFSTPNQESHIYKSIISESDMMIYDDSMTATHEGDNAVAGSLRYTNMLNDSAEEDISLYSKDDGVSFPVEITVDGGKIIINGYYVTELFVNSTYTSMLSVDMTYGDTLTQSQIDDAVGSKLKCIAKVGGEGLRVNSTEVFFKYPSSYDGVMKDKVYYSERGNQIFFDIVLQRNGSASVEGLPIELIFPYESRQVLREGTILADDIVTGDENNNIINCGSNAKQGALRRSRASDSSASNSAAQTPQATEKDKKDSNTPSPAPSEAPTFEPSIEPEPTQTPTPAPVSNSPKISLAEYNKIKEGMTYSQVVEIVGGEGELLAETDLGIGAEYVAQVYMWEGEGSLGANANVTFSGGKVYVKAQYGLK